MLNIEACQFLDKTDGRGAEGWATWIAPLQVLDDEVAVWHHIGAVLDVGKLQGNASAP